MFLINKFIDTTPSVMTDKEVSKIWTCIIEEIDMYPAHAKNVTIFILI